MKRGPKTGKKYDNTTAWHKLMQNALAPEAKEELIEQAHREAMFFRDRRRWPEEIEYGANGSASPVSTEKATVQEMIPHAGVYVRRRKSRRKSRP